MRRQGYVRLRLRTTVTLILRAAALFLAAFTAVGLVGELRGRTLDPSLWWVDLRALPSDARLVLLATFAGLLGTWAARPLSGPGRRWATAGVCATFAAFAIRDAVQFYSLVKSGSVRPAVDVPLSALTAVLLILVAIQILKFRGESSPTSRREAVGLLMAVGAWAVVFPLAQMLFFGSTDYRRPVDAAVVLGARVYTTGQASPLLADRIQTAVDLYKSGLTPVLIMSGGDGNDGYNEARVMRDVAIADGVDPAAILVDPAGNSTEATVANVAALLRTRNGSAAPFRLIAVSQAYHLPRVQLAFEDAGIDALTVPAVDPQPIGEMPLLIAREVPAFWDYFLRICLG